MNRAVWSFWSKPYRAYYHRAWHSELTHLLSWALSVAEAANHYPITCLHTDSTGAELLVDRLKLPFRRVELTLDLLDAEDDLEWWVLGKLSTYATQTEPFVHLDSDVILWKPLPPHLTQTAIFAQNPERFSFEEQSLYRIDAFMRGIVQGDGWVPPQWAEYAARQVNRAICCGILGGNDTALLARYAALAMEVVRHPRNRPIFPSLGVRDNILVEQYFLAAFLDWHARHAPGGAAASVGFLFPSSNDAFDPREAERVGYTHLIGDTKANPDVAARLAARVRRHHPRLYEACMAAAGG
ncbi:DUF6734 family protein [Neoroseomonas lacus]|uniref:DUF6734 domain-containing protein n=1 Tax=Neoroseomonas lacus TaxID=287609 RepID=A0A917NWQ5_9PROT|nr:DUF6734 family protein [Neoroseomonas lacus]GGJ35534.1 hypothetical protein GCM10011320_49100 [Neoroseomonas lacus]